MVEEWEMLGVYSVRYMSLIGCGWCLVRGVGVEYG